MKGARLRELADLGLRVPPFTVIAPDDPIEQVLDFVNAHPGPFAVRSSADVEDGTVASFAGIFETYLSVPAEDVVRHVELVRASLLGDRALEYASRVGQSPQQMHVVVQQMAACKVAGVAFSSHPARQRRRIVVQAGWGLGETVVAELAETDEFEIEPETGAVVRARIGRQTQQIVGTPTGPRTEPVAYLEQCRRKLTAAQLASIRECIELVRAALDVEVDLEWGFDEDGMLALQVRPLTRSDAPQDAACVG